MVMTLRKRNRVVPIQTETESDSEIELQIPKMKTKKLKKNPKKKGESSSSSSDDDDDDDDSSNSENEDEVTSGYEKFREQRMKENRERMLKLGMFSLASQVFNPKNKTGNGGAKKKKKPPAPKRKRLPPLYPRPPRESRRSARLVKLVNGEYLESEGLLKDMGISVPAAWEPEVYTEEHVKLLGDCQTNWTLKHDGFNEDGDRLYDPYGTPCHQCRQKVLGKLTYCGKCRSPHGQFCGDCLYTRYGENILEAIQNPSWSCPVCRAICNCSRCRRSKGWQPINIQHSKIVESGFKSVAHYLILTRRAGAPPIELNDGIATVDSTTDDTKAPPQNEGSDYSAELSEFESDDSDTDDESHGKNNKDRSVGIQAEETNEPVGLNDGIETVDLTEETAALQQNEDSHYSADDSEGKNDKEQSVGIQAEETNESVGLNDGIATDDLTEETTVPQQNEDCHNSADDSEGKINKDQSVGLQAEGTNEPVGLNNGIATVDLTEETAAPQQNEGSHYSADNSEGKNNKEQSVGIQAEETNESVGLNDGIATVDLTEETTVPQQTEGSHYSADYLEGNNKEQSNEVAIAADKDQAL